VRVVVERSIFYNGWAYSPQGGVKMGQGWESRRRPPGRPAVGSGKTPADIAKELRAGKVSRGGYREESLRIHGFICAKCGREFDGKSRHLLTVHHRDGNHHNNPPDGSNWENLCVYCHEDEHSRGRLGTYLSGDGD